MKPPPLATARTVGLALAIALVSGLAYLTALPGAFHFDDLHAIVQNPALAQTPFAQILVDPMAFSGLGTPMYRPITVLSFALHVALGAFNPAAMIAVNLLLHVIAVAVFFGVAHALFRDRTKAAIAAAIFGLHPIQSQAINYISCRSTLLAACFGLCSILLFLSALSRRGASRAVLAAAMAAALALALLSKSEAFAVVFAPAVILYALGPRISSRSHGWRLAAICLVIGVLYLGVRLMVGVDVVLPARPVRPIADNLATGARVAFHYLRLALWPLGLSVAHDVAASKTFFDPWAILAMGTMAAGLVIFHRLRLRAPMLLTGWLWYLLGLAPTTTLAPLNAIISEHRVYFSMAGLSLLAVELGSRLGRRTDGRRDLPPRSWPWRHRGLLVFFALALAWIGGVQARNRAWNADIRLWRAAVRVAPASLTAWSNLGTAYYEGYFDAKSKAAFQRALALDPNLLPAMTNLGRLYVEAGENERGVKMMERALVQAPNEPDIHYNLGVGYQELGQFKLAESHFQETLRLWPGHVKACERLAALYIFKLPDAKKAEDTLTHCMSQNPAPEEMEKIKAMFFALMEMKGR